MAQTTIDDAINGLKDDDVNIKMDSLEYLMNVNDEIAIDTMFLLIVALLYKVNRKGEAYESCH